MGFVLIQQPILSLEHITFAYEDQPPALDDLSVSLYKGERVAVLGSNGAGKSTFFLVCNGVLEPGEGSVVFRGKVVTRKRAALMELRKNVGIVFQDPENQLIASTVESEISFGPMNLGLGREEVKNRVEGALTKMDLTNLRGRAPHYLSGGEKKRVSIGDILAMEPEVILFDEPTASLDPRNVALLEQNLDMLSQAGIALVVSTHDVDFAYGFAQRGLVFSRGKLLADQEMDEIFSHTELLAQAGLRKPMLYEAGELLRERYGLKGRPKTMGEFHRFLMT